MKLSNKILASFFGLAFIYLTALFAEVRFRGTHNIINEANSIAETVDLSGVSYLVLQDLDQDIAVVGSDRPRLEVRSSSGDFLKGLKYHISADTLTLSEFRMEERRTVRISVFLPEGGFKGMTVNDAHASLKGFEQELLYLSQNAGRIWMSDSKIAKVYLEIRNKSNLHITGTVLDTVSANIDNSEVVISSPLGFLQGSMKNNAFLRTNAIDEIQFKKDSSSRLNMYE
jgi:hypothetical protein